MPKLVSEEARARTQEAIYSYSIHLIKEKGLRNITVEDIASAVGIGKGSFYSYYPSKEAWLYDVIKRGEREVFAQLEQFMASGAYSNREKMVRFLQAVYTAPESLIAHVSEKDVEMLLRKLPSEYHEKERQKVDTNFQTALQLMQLEERQMEVVALLTNCLSFVASNRSYSHPGTKAALNVLIDALAGYILKEKKGGGKNDGKQ